jgi:hypothetical protein
MNTGNRLVLELYFWTKQGEKLWDYFEVDSVATYRETLNRRFPTFETELITLTEIDDNGQKIKTVIDFRITVDNSETIA